MLTKLTIRRFKRFEDVEVELGSPVVFIGPNNSGKTSAMQALALWHTGLTQWNAKRAGKRTPEKRPGVTINRRDLVSIPIPSVKLAWRDLRVRDVRYVGGKQQTRNIRIDIIVEGVTRGRAWTCGLEFDYANDESVYCRPLRLTEDRVPDRMPVPDEAGSVRMAFLPPMSGLAAAETRLDEGAVNVRRLGKPSPWGADLKVSTEFLKPLLTAYFSKLGLPNLMPKGNFYRLVGHMPPADVDPEVSEKLDAIACAAESATPPQEQP
ncbi:AAA family ATPase [Candidatus Palauibacter sp.]|uniref:AAA family ATPase n=1 Tax=Candidatus Palauibacter sp. TaxID=3101350 RepID=UPI003B52079D